MLMFAKQRNPHILSVFVCLWASYLFFTCDIRNEIFHYREWVHVESCKPYQPTAAVAHVLNNTQSPDKQSKHIWYRHNILWKGRRSGLCDESLTAVQQGRRSVPVTAMIEESLSTWVFRPALNAVTHCLSLSITLGRGEVWKSRPPVWRCCASGRPFPKSSKPPLPWWDRG